MKVAQDTFLVQVESAKRSTIKIGSSELVIDTDYNKYKHNTQIGTIYGTPVSMTFQYLNDTALNVGDTVLFHHFVCKPNHKMFDGVFLCKYYFIYAKIVDNMVEPIEDTIFVDPIKENEDDLFCGSFKIRNTVGKVKKKGVVFAASKKARSLGILPGDLVHFTENADYEMNFVGKTLYRMRLRNIVCVERGNEFVCPADKVMVEFVKLAYADVKFKTEENHQMMGIVKSYGSKVPVVEVGDEVNFFAPVDGLIEQEGKKIYFVEPRHINYIKN